MQTVRRMRPRHPWECRRARRKRATVDRGSAAPRRRQARVAAHGGPCPPAPCPMQEPGGPPHDADRRHRYDRPEPLAEVYWRAAGTHTGADTAWGLHMVSLLGEEATRPRAQGWASGTNVTTRRGVASLGSRQIDRDNSAYQRAPFSHFNIARRLEIFAQCLAHVGGGAGWKTQHIPLCILDNLAWSGLSAV